MSVSDKNNSLTGYMVPLITGFTSKAFVVISYRGMAFSTWAKGVS